MKLIICSHCISLMEQGTQGDYLHINDERLAPPWFDDQAFCLFHKPGYQEWSRRKIVGETRTAIYIGAPDYLFPTSYD